MAGLTDQDRAILEFEDQQTSHSGSKEEAIRSGFGIKASVYYYRLNRILDEPAALAEFPQLVYRLRELRRRRSEARASRRFLPPVV